MDCACHCPTIAIERFRIVVQDFTSCIADVLKCAIEARVMQLPSSGKCMAVATSDFQVLHLLHVSQ